MRLMDGLGMMGYLAGGGGGGEVRIVLKLESIKSEHSTCTTGDEDRGFLEGWGIV